MDSDPAAPEHVVDLERYPVLDPSSEAYERVVSAGRAQMAALGAAELSGFVTAVGVKILAAEDWLGRAPRRHLDARRYAGRGRKCSPFWCLGAGWQYVHGDETIAAIPGRLDGRSLSWSSFFSGQPPSSGLWSLECPVLLQQRRSLRLWRRGFTRRQLGSLPVMLRPSSLVLLLSPLRSSNPSI